MAKENRETTDKLRSDIDHGEAGDKVDFADPAAAPLGTDAEAGGAPPSTEEVERARSHEVKRSDDETAGRSDRQFTARQTTKDGGAGKWVIWAVVVCAVLLIAWAILT